MAMPRLPRSPRFLSSLGISCIALFSSMPMEPAQAQSLKDEIAASRLSAGYAQLLGLAATPDISSANYKIPGEGNQTYDVLRIPYESRWLTLSDNSELFWRVSAGYLDYDATIPVDADLGSKLKYDSTAFSGSFGVFSRTNLGHGFTLEPGLDVGLARLINRSDFVNISPELIHVLNGQLVNWHTNATLVTPNIGISWESNTDQRSIRVSGHVSYSWISSFDESKDFASFKENSGAYSLRAEWLQPTSLQLFSRPLSWVASAGYGGFYGANRQELGFSSVADVGLGFAVPLRKDAPKSTQVVAGAAYLFGPNVSGWSASIGLRY